MKNTIVLPKHDFLWTRDQIMHLLSVDNVEVLNRMIYFEGRSTGAPPKGMLRAINIMPAGVKPEWRIAESELKRWMRYKDFRSLLR
jgi:hypothetical protein